MKLFCDYCRQDIDVLSGSYFGAHRTFCVANPKLNMTINKLQNKRKTKCDKCGRDISVSNFDKHFKVCTGVKVKRIRGIDYVPGYKTGTHTAWNKGLTKETHPSLALAGLKMADWYARGNRPKVTDSTREKLSQNAIEHKVGGYKPNAGHSKKFYVKDSSGNDVCLQSSYEFECYKVLTQLEIKWSRPRFLKYGDKKYFPDFYLNDYDIYLDPKNNYLIKVDKEKIQRVLLENKIRLYILPKNQITQDYITSLLHPSLNWQSRCSISN